MALVLVVLTATTAGCSKEGSESSSPSSTAASTAPTTAPATTAGAPSTSTSTPPATRGPVTITRNNLTLHAPTGWIAEGSLNYYGVGPVPRPPGTALIAVEALFGYADTIDSLKPAACEAQPGNNLPKPTNVNTVESGFRPVGDRTAEYRNWSVTCPNGTTEGHRAWLLPQSKIALYERCRMDAVGDIIATAQVSDATGQTSTTVRSPKPESPFSCKG